MKPVRYLAVALVLAALGFGAAAATTPTASTQTTTEPTATTQPATTGTTTEPATTTIPPPPALTTPVPRARSKPLTLAFIHISLVRTQTRLLVLALRVSRVASARAWLRRDGRLVASAGTRRLSARPVLRLRLPRSARPGAYNLTVRAVDARGTVRVIRRTLRFRADR